MHFRLHAQGFLYENGHSFYRNGHFIFMGHASPGRGAHALDLSKAETSHLSVTGVLERYPAGHIVPEHSHRRGHLIHATEGVLLVEAESGRWLVPPTAAVWLRPGVSHRLVVTVPVCAHGIFVREDVTAGLPTLDCVIHISALMREMIAALVKVSYQPPHSQRDELLGALFVEELKAAPSLPFHLPWPGDGQIRQICDALARDPGSDSRAEEWAAVLAMSTKTFHRRFQKSTGMSFGKWRQQMRLMTSITMLLEGASITSAALDSGYQSHSAYSTAFRKHFGYPPSEFLTAAKQKAAPLSP